jgi:hypothetical protein
MKMDEKIRNAIRRVSRAVASRKPDRICTENRFLRYCCVHVTECYWDAWTDECAKAVLDAIERSLAVLREIIEEADAKGDEDTADLARFSFCRVFRRLRDLFAARAVLFQQDAEGFEQALDAKGKYPELHDTQGEFEYKFDPRPAMASR